MNNKNSFTLKLWKLNKFSAVNEIIKIYKFPVIDKFVLQSIKILKELQ